MKTFECSAVGLQHRLTASTRRMLAKRVREDGGIQVMLVREHDNAADENAIKVVVRNSPYKGMHVGYLPREVAKVYAPALDEIRIRVKDATLWEVNPDEGTGSLKIRVTKPKALKTPGNKPRKKKPAKGA